MTQTTKMTTDFIADPGHGWLRVTPAAYDWRQ